MSKQHTYIYQITLFSPENMEKETCRIYARNKRSAKQWLANNRPEFRAKITCIGEKKEPLQEPFRPFTQQEELALLSQIKMPQVLHQMTLHARSKT